MSYEPSVESVSSWSRQSAAQQKYWSRNSRYNELTISFVIIIIYIMAADWTGVLCSRLDPDQCIVTILSSYIQSLQVGTQYNKHMHKSGKICQHQATGGTALIECYVYSNKRDNHWTCKRRTLFVNRLQICGKINPKISTNSITVGIWLLLAIVY